MKAILILIGIGVVGAAGFVGGFAYRAKVNIDRHATPAQAQRHVLYWQDPMHPAYKSDKPGIAPDCGMKLEPVYEEGGGADASHTGQLKISTDKQQLVGVTYGQAEWASASSSFRAVGKVSMDETRVVRVHPKIEGWIEQVFADFMGAQVDKGQRLATIYSPEMLAAEQDYLLAIQARSILKNSPLAEAAQNSESLIRASRMRLELWDLSAGQIEEIETTKKTQKTITLYAPASGVVIARNAFPNQKVSPETELFAISDLSRVWVMADVFESDAANVRLGQSAMIQPSYGGGKAFSARVSFIQPQVDPATRTLKVRLEAANPGLQLKPDMFVDVQFQVASQRKLTVPAEAVLDAGRRKTVFIDRGKGYLEPREVQVGERLGDRIEIVRGLQAGEQIVTSGNFLIDSESQLRNAGGHEHDQPHH
jgi:Cu(I)/Ag(I) efflux system membrane fusion protein